MIYFYGGFSASMLVGIALCYVETYTHFLEKPTKVKICPDGERKHPQDRQSDRLSMV